LQELVDDVSAAKRGGRVKPTADASAEAVRERRAPGDHPAESVREEGATQIQPVAEEVQPDAPEDFDEGVEESQEPQPSAKKSGSNLPDLILIDGGKGQLGMAMAELKKLGLENIPVIGLAKEFEEIYQPGKSTPLRLSHDTGALKLLQRVRDESHRFANTYNAQLRLKRISESILDEFPNIGEKRKAALLKKFGSVQRMRLATVEQIAEVSGFGGKAAGELKTFLTARTETPAEKVPQSENGAG
jgi:excinuclease ABC subunit C